MHKHTEKHHPNGVPKLDWLAKQIMDALSENIKDKAYLASKCDDLANLDRLRVARKIANLDAKNQQSLANILGVTTDDLAAFNRVLTKI